MREAPYMKVAPSGSRGAADSHSESLRFVTDAAATPATVGSTNDRTFAPPPQRIWTARGRYKLILTTYFMMPIALGPFALVRKVSSLTGSLSACNNKFQCLQFRLVPDDSHIPYSGMTPWFIRNGEATDWNATYSERLYGSPPDYGDHFGIRSPSPLCPGASPQEMRNKCGNQDIMENVFNDLPNRRILIFFYGFLMLYVGSNWLHDVGLSFHRIHENDALMLNIISCLSLTGLFANAWRWSEGVLELFYSEVSPGCGCFYQLGDFAAILVFALPFSLYLHLNSLVQNALRAVVGGDYILNRKFVVPVRLMGQSRYALGALEMGVGTHDRNLSEVNLEKTNESYTLHDAASGASQVRAIVPRKVVDLIAPYLPLALLALFFQIISGGGQLILFRFFTFLFSWCANDTGTTGVTRWICSRLAGNTAVIYWLSILINYVFGARVIFERVFWKNHLVLAVVRGQRYWGKPVTQPRLAYQFLRLMYFWESFMKRWRLPKDEYKTWSKWDRWHGIALVPVYVCLLYCVNFLLPLEATLRQMTVPILTMLLAWQTVSTLAGRPEKLYGSEELWLQEIEKRACRTEPQMAWVFSANMEGPSEKLLAARQDDVCIPTK